MITTGFAKDFSYSSYVYHVMSIDCIKAYKQTLNHVSKRYIQENSPLLVEHHLQLEPDTLKVPVIIKL